MPSSRRHLRGGAASAYICADNIAVLIAFLGEEKEDDTRCNIHVISSPTATDVNLLIEIVLC